MRTIDSFEDYVERIDEVINDIFLPVLFCQTGPLPDELREPFPIAPAQGALGIPHLKAETSQQYAASKVIRAPHINNNLIFILRKIHVNMIKCALHERK